MASPSFRSIRAGPARFTRRCPGSRAVGLQRLEDHPAERGPLAHRAQPRSPMQVARHASNAVDSRARLATILLIHGFSPPRSNVVLTISEIYVIYFMNGGA